MGNCIVVQESVVRIMKSDGKFLEYKAPIKVHQILKQFSGHAISESLPIVQHLDPNTKLLKGQLYYLVPLPQPSAKGIKKKVRFAGTDEVIRIKLVISKQELKEMLQHKGGISVDEMLSLVEGEKEILNGVNVCDEKNYHRSQEWKPMLETIPELN